MGTRRQPPPLPADGQKAHLEAPPECCAASGLSGCSDPVIDACVCAVDDFCCITAWDEICVAEIESANCGTCCGNGTCDPAETCNDCPADCGPCGDPCGDGECSEEETCASCPTDCGFCEGDCCNDNGSIGCFDAVFTECVCPHDGYCCENNWDSLCASSVRGELAVTPEALTAITDCVDGWWLECTESAEGWHARFNPAGRISCDADASPTDATHCRSGLPCNEDSDCASGICHPSGLCTPAACADALVNGLETDWACGGPCGPCALGENCNEGTDCVSGACNHNVCVQPVCANQVRDLDESDVDCGGPSCPGCPRGASCGTSEDCAIDACVDGVCGAPSCDDGFHNGEETDTDCGGPDCGACLAGRTCITARDCRGSVCAADGRCAQSTCEDNVRNGEETDVDCGGLVCPACAPGSACTETDCSGPSACIGGRCIADNLHTHAPARGPEVSPSIELDWRFLLDAGFQGAVDPAALPEGTLGLVHGRVIQRRTDLDDPVVGVPGVKVRVLNRPEFGQTGTRADGRFEFLVRGGARYTLELSHPDYLSAQRSFRVGWEDEAVLADVTVTPVSPTETTVLADAPFAQWALGDPSPAEALELVPGEPMLRQARTAAVLFPPGTQAIAVLPDGPDPDTDPDRAPLADFTVRFTEFTTGSDGPQAMPAPLPSYSGYNYAVDLRVDEAHALGALRTDFVAAADGQTAQPALFYVENFRGLEAGQEEIEVPVGLFDEQLGVWVEQASGHVVEVLDDNGATALDRDADGLPDPGYAPWELTALGERYAPGTQLWRVEMPHFSIPDLNWQIECDTEFASCSKPRNGAKIPEPPLTCSSKQPGSIIECENQILGKTAPLFGTPFALAYRSSRVPGFEPVREIPVKLTGATVQEGLKSIIFHYASLGNDTASGAVFHNPGPELWTAVDGEIVDGVGRRLHGSTSVYINIGYVYPARSRMAGFSSPGNSSSFFSNGQYGNDWITWTQQIVPWRRLDARQFGMGGWTLSGHHSYDPRTRSLYLGSGERRTIDRFAYVTENVAGRGVFNGDAQVGYTPDGETAQGSIIGRPLGMAVDSFGRLYFAEGTQNLLGGGRIRSIGSDGRLRTERASNADDLPAGITLDSQGRVVFADWQRHCVVRIHNDPNRTEETLVGQCDRNAPGTDPLLLDGVPATAARLNRPGGVAFAPDGSLLLTNAACLSTEIGCDQVNADLHRVLRVYPDGTLHTIAGGGPGTYDYGNLELDDDNELQPGGRALEASLLHPAGIAVDDHGEIYVSDFGHNQVRRITPDGRIYRHVGRAADADPACSEGDRWTPGVDRLEACLHRPLGVTVQGGGLFIADSPVHSSFRGRVAWVDPSGAVDTVMGAASPRTPGPGAFGDETELRGPVAAVVAPNGALYVSDSRNAWIARLDHPLPGSQIEIRVPSADGKLEYVFTRGGRHLATDAAVSGLRLLTFGYADGRLSSVTDAHGNVTALHYDADNRLDYVVAARGQVTQVQVGGDGWLDEVVLPGNRVFTYEHDPTGLLTESIDPRGAVSTYVYDGTGRLLSTDGPDGSQRTLNRLELPKERPNYDHWAVDHTTQLGRKTTYTVQQTTEGKVRKTTFPDGSRVSSVARGSVATKTIPYNETQGGRVTASTTVESTSNAHWRYGMVAPDREVTTTTPGGRVITESTTRVDASTVDPPSRGEETTSLRNGLAWTRTEVHDDDGHTVSVQTPEQRTVVHTYDEQGRIIRSEIPGSGLHPVERSWYPDGKLQSVRVGPEGDPATRTTTFTYTSVGAHAGAVKTVTDPAGRHATFLYDDTTGDLLQQTLPGGRVVDFGRSEHGDLVSIDPPGPSGEHGFSHDVMGRRTGYATADLAPPSTPCSQDSDCAGPETCAGGTCAAPDRRTDTVYDLDQNVDLVTTQSGTTVDPAYDDSGRVNGVDVSGEGLTQILYDDDGRPWKWIAPSGEAFEVLVDWPEDDPMDDDDDELFKVVTQRWIDPLGDARGAVIQAFDANGRLVRESLEDAAGLPAGSTVDYTYDDDGLLTQMNLDNPQQTINYGRNDITGALETVTVGDLTTTYAYNAFGEVASVLTTRPDGPDPDNDPDIVYGYILDAPGFERDRLGRIVQRVEIVEGVSTTYGYTYDDAGRLTQVDVNGVMRWAYDYDDNGNRTYYTDADAGIELFPSDFEYDARDRLMRQGTILFTYDANDRLESQEDTATGERMELVYDTAGSLLSATGYLLGVQQWQVTYTLDPMGRRIGRHETVGGIPTPDTTWLYRDALKPAATITAGIPDQNIYGTTALAADFRATQGSLSRVATDHLGSTRSLVNPAGGVATPSGTYSPFGRLDSGIDDWMGFAAGVADSRTGLVRFGARDYAPGFGRWSAPDPIRFRAGSANLFGYVGSDPISSVDPTGLLSWHANGVWVVAGTSGPLWTLGAVASYSYAEHLYGYAAGRRPKSTEPKLVIAELDDADTRASAIHHRDTDECFSVYTHSTASGGPIGHTGFAPQTRYWTPRELGDVIGAHPGYRDGMCVTLYGCSLGGGTYAQSLADRMGVPVRASTIDIVLTPAGDVLGGNFVEFVP